MRGVPASAPKSEAESAVGDVVPSRSSGASVSSSKLRQTATRAPLGHDFGVSFLPTRARSTASRSWDSVHLVPGWLAPCCCACAEETVRLLRATNPSARRSGDGRIMRLLLGRSKVGVILAADLQ